jgi:SAM-dependent methyltransferase
MRRVGWTIHSRHPGDVFEERGRLQWDFIKSLLPADWGLGGRRVLDFGCGVGRILLPAIESDPTAEYWGCDVHAPSIEWLRGQVSPTTNVLCSAEWPPLSIPDEHFDLIYAFSVFTHLDESWSAWLVDLHRLLKPDGFLVITVYGPGHEAFGTEPVHEDSIGMNVLFPFNSWDIGGPLVAHSEWWLRARWGRAFEIVDLRPGDPAGPPPLFGQGVVVLRKRAGRIAPDELERPEPEEPRELDALRANVASLRRELALKIEVYETSLSWRVTTPIRKLGAVVRRIRRSLD